MRFSRLSLERYGRFEDCELNFRPGSPDLHIIYGANEAGKTTSLAAVSDFLFGFPARSPYNFLFDYSLLRVGAVLQDGPRTLACRRKKGTGSTLVDAADAPINEAALIAMLNGQTRETFALSFSLNQVALRAGGRAMVDAKNDLGRTLFAAGSGLTGIADELGKLESEAEAIWAPTTAQRRTFTKAQSQLAEATKAIRDSALKPKAWSDARKADEETRTALETARNSRDKVQAELKTLERIRRLAPLIGDRKQQLEGLQRYEGTIDLGRQREDYAEQVAREADEAERQRVAADQLRADAAERRGKVETDPAVLARADDIDQLVADAGAEEKAARDLSRLKADLTAAEVETRRLRSEAGANADATPPRAVGAMLRELARAHGEISAANREISESRSDIEDRKRRAQARLNDSAAVPLSDSLIDAVDAARALGSDADTRCDAARRKVEASSSAIAPLLARLAPWSGGIDELLALPRVGEPEIETVRAELTEIMALAVRENEQASRFADQIACGTLEIGQLATGAAVSPEDIASAKQIRYQRWLPLREHILSGVELSSPKEAVADFEASVSLVDDKMELRFKLADASSRLLLLEQDKARDELQSLQARTRAENLRRRYAIALEAWRGRLAGAGLPILEPAQFQAWQTDRAAAEAGYDEYLDFCSDRDQIIERRDACRDGLAGALGAESVGPLAPLLAKAERKLKDLQESAQQRRTFVDQLDQIAAELTAVDRRQQGLDKDMTANAAAWEAALVDAGLQMSVFTCGAVLDLLEELRQSTKAEADLRRRVDGIQRDARDHVSRVDALADHCSVAPADPATRLRTLRDRLVLAQTSAALERSLEEEEERRLKQADEAAAKLKATEIALAPLLAQIGSTDRTSLLSAIERSREKRRLSEALASIDRRIITEGDGLSLDEAVVTVAASDVQEIAGRISQLDIRLTELNNEVDRAAAAHGDARSAFAAINPGAMSAVDAATDAEQARSELEVLAEHYILKRAQAVTLRWAIEKYRERNQDPLLLRAGQLFSILTVGRYSALRVDADGPSPRLLGLRDDGRTMVEVGAMSEGTADQLFFALRLAALEQSVASGVNLPFLADDLFVNFDDQRAEAGFKVLADVAKSTQVLFFTHHAHLLTIAKRVVGADLHSECALS